LVTGFAGYQELAFTLSDKDRALLSRLTPAAFDGDRAWWGQSLSTAAMQQGDVARARIYADSSLATAREQIEAAPDDPQLRMINAVMLAYAGRKSEALQEAEIAILDTLPGQLDNTSYVQLQYVRTLLAVGERDRALDQLELLTKRQYYISPQYLRVDPMFRPLDGNPRFERLANRGIGAPVD
jgi:predicted Zn-dependent protease